MPDRHLEHVEGRPDDEQADRPRHDKAQAIGGWLLVPVRPPAFGTIAPLMACAKRNTSPVCASEACDKASRQPALTVISVPSLDGPATPMRQSR